MYDTLKMHGMNNINLTKSSDISEELWNIKASHGAEIHRSQSTDKSIIFRTCYHIFVNFHIQMTITIHVTGLDPAGSLFTNQKCEVRLCKGDAEFTEAIHTNGDPLFGPGTSDDDGKYVAS
jgi:hypothetical protein